MTKDSFIPLFLFKLKKFSVRPAPESNCSAGDSKESKDKLANLNVISKTPTTTCSTEREINALERNPGSTEIPFYTEGIQRIK